MSTFLILLIVALVAIVSATTHLPEDKTTFLRSEIIDEINAMKTTWKAAKSPRFTNATLADFKRLLGTILPNETGYEGPELERTSYHASATIPTDFDARTAFSKCANIIGHVRDQSDCGSCWAFGSTEAFNDRYCITTGDATTLFAPEDTVSCCSGLTCSMSMGCNGGQPAGAWKWFTKEGVSSGGDWGSTGTCKPYSMQTCAHHVTPPPGMISCTELNGGNEYATPKCSSECTDKTYTTPYKSDKHKASSSYSVKGVSNMQQELMEKGTLSVSMNVYEDFESYSSGVYQHKTGKSLGGHAIKMIGWGVDNGTPYWTCVNSWNNSWGEQGIFRILRGSDECGIESGVVAGDV